MSDSVIDPRARVVELALLDAAQHGGPHAVDAIIAKLKADPGYVEKLLKKQDKSDSKASPDQE